MLSMPWKLFHRFWRVFGFHPTSSTHTLWGIHLITCSLCPFQAHTHQFFHSLTVLHTITLWHVTLYRRSVYPSCSQVLEGIQDKSMHIYRFEGIHHMPFFYCWMSIVYLHINKEFNTMHIEFVISLNFYSTKCRQCHIKSLFPCPLMFLCLHSSNLCVVQVALHKKWLSFARLLLLLYFK